MLKILLGNGAQRAKDIVAGFKPMFESKEAFLVYIDGLNRSSERVYYKDNGTVEAIID